jgi:hypothetical protein
MDFCVRDDDTSFFTGPEELESAYGEISRTGPVSLAIVPFCRSGPSRGVPEPFRNRWTVHPLEENIELVDYLREAIARGRYEAMLHGYHHDERDGAPEFSRPRDLARRARHGRQYLEDLLGTTITAFVPPHNRICRAGLHAMEKAGLHLGGVAGVRSGWPIVSARTWRTWLRLRRWRQRGGVGVPFRLDMDGHNEVPGTPITPLSRSETSEAAFDAALAGGGVFCAATHYWELGAPSRHSGEPTVGQQLRRLIDRAAGDSRIVWRTLGAIATGPADGSVRAAAEPSLTGSHSR